MTEHSHWEQLTDLFDRASQVELEKRADWLSEACQGDERLYAEVDSLLRAARQAPSFLEKPASAMMPHVLTSSPDGLSAGDTLGGYRLQERVGIGGMGSVWRATPLKQPETAIALKVLWQRSATPLLLRRFANERRSLARLHHPNIARLVDGGVSDTGRPFLAMEYVEGLALDRWCDAHHSSVAERVDLVRAICDAVHYAHRNLIVHRDLKPDNILVTSDGTPKLLDFGIAKLLADDDDELSAATLTEFRAMTPQYASPEQVRGEGVSTSSDIYSLGVILYELLTGRRPYRLPAGFGAETQRVIADIRPQRPSMVVLREPTIGDCKTGSPDHSAGLAENRKARPESLARQLAGDLDNIVLMAMHKEPARRYASAEHLAADLRRVRLGRPVEARIDEWHYRLGKFTRRHLLAVSLATVTLLALIGGVIGTSWQARRAAGLAEFARSEANVLHRVVELMNDSQREYAAKSASGDTRSLGEFFVAHADRMRQEMEGDARDLAAFEGAVGETYAAFGQLEAAERMLAESLRLRRGLYPATHPETAEALFRYGHLLYLRGRPGEALPAVAEAVQIWRAAWGPDHADIAQAQALLGLTLMNLSEHAAALRELSAAETLLSRHFGADHPRSQEVRAARVLCLAALDRAE